MAAIINVNSNSNLSMKRVMTKLSFELGETFMARIVNLDEKTSELLLKLLDGWQFNAKLENPLNFVPNGLVKFVVQGFEGDKLLIKLVPVKDGEGEQNSSIDNILKDKSLNVGKEDFDLLEKMVKNNIPLTRENISSLKTLVDFKNKLELNQGEKDAFINKYINSKGIDINSSEGKEMKTNLDSFFKELKNIEVKDLLTLKGNNIEVTDENIKSFNKLFKEPKAIYKSILEVGQALQSEKTDVNNYNKLEDKTNFSKAEGTINDELRSMVDQKEAFQNESLSKLTKVLEKNEIKSNIVKLTEEGKASNKEIKEAAENETLKNQNKITVEDKGIKKGSNIVVENKNNMTAESNNLKNNTKGVAESITVPVEDKNSKEGRLDSKLQHSEEQDLTTSLVIKQDKEKSTLINEKDTSRLVKEQINIKTSQLKDIIKNLIQEKLNLEPDAYDKLIQNIKGNINDFKVFNSISNQYYYLDMPLKVRNEEYDCKLIIKDDRKKDKNIDTKNVKLVVTVSTSNMGVVDSYIKVNNKNMNIDIKCEEAWVKNLDIGKSEILKGLENNGYNIHVSVEKKQEEATLSNCSHFFNDVSISTINTRV